MRVRRLPARCANHQPNHQFLPWLAAAALLSGTALVLAPGSAAAAFSTDCSQSGSTVTCTYNFNGATNQTFTPPAGITTATITLTGGSGGKGANGGFPGGTGGFGAKVTGTLTGLTGQPLTMFVGGHGADGAFLRNGGPPSPGGFGYGSGGAGGALADSVFYAGGGGGGASAIVAGITPLAVAGAGAGGGGASPSLLLTGGGGGASGADGSPPAPSSAHGQCGGSGVGHAGAQPTPTGGDATGPPDNGNGVPGGSGDGHNRFATVPTDNGGGGGGGGGGVHGGSGGSSGTSFGGGCGGGGGTSLPPPGGTVTDGVNSGDGQITISYDTMPTTTSLGVTPPPPSLAGTQETLTATVTPATAVGSVVFSDGTAPIDSVPVSSGMASTTPKLPVGTHSLTATFAPTDPTAFTSSTSTAVPYTVYATATTSTLTAAPNPTFTAIPVILIARVTPFTAAGSVVFSDDTTPLSPPVPVNAGIAVFTSPPLPAGSHTLTAAYTPTKPTAFGPSTSPPVPLTVNALF